MSLNRLCSDLYLLGMVAIKLRIKIGSESLLVKNADFTKRSLFSY